MSEAFHEGAIGRSSRETLAVVLAGGRGRRLHELTAIRSKPAVPFAGKFRIIDFCLSNCINSGIRKIAILTQYRSHSLIQHIERGWNFSRAEFGEFIEILPAQERDDASLWYQGTADAVYQNLDIIREHKPRLLLILAGDHVYKMDYGAMLSAMLAHEADLVVGCVEVPIADGNQFGIMEIDNDDRIVGFEEKPQWPKCVPGDSSTAFGSMGIYLFRAEFLYRILDANTAAATTKHDFGRDVIPNLIAESRVYACPFRDLAHGGQAYWRDVGTIDAYWRANLEIAGVTPPLNLYDEDWPVRTASRELPPAKFVFDEDGRRGMAVDSLVCSGCIVSGATVRRSVLSSKVRVGCGSVIVDSVVLPDAVIGEACRITKAVIDSGCVIPDGTIIGEDVIADRQRFRVSDGGVVLVCPAMLGQRGSHAA
ncbi:MAG: glucose-1-phosphate adenylyltransferase [Gammaproteobacteria bacterium]|jgi:glucose-1-phosphate adenylyltransferase